jgi:hypothetical protein
MSATKVSNNVPGARPSGCTLLEKRGLCPARAVEEHREEHGRGVRSVQSAQGRQDAGRGADAAAGQPASSVMDRLVRAMMTARGPGSSSGPSGDASAVEAPP